MEMNRAILALAALAHESRLRVFRSLVQAGPDGLSAGAVAETLEIPAATLSFHLAHLERAGLVSGTRQGRHIIYAAAYAGLADLIHYLVEDCCQGRADMAALLATQSQPCCGGTAEGAAVPTPSTGERS